MDLLDAIGQDSGGGGSGTLCVNGCSYTNSANTLTIGPGGTTGPTVYGKASGTGAACGSNTSGVTAAPNQGGDNCIVASGHTLCVNDSTSNATINSDVVNPSQIPAGGCVGYGDGSAACNASTSPPVPNNGNQGSPATPTAIVGDNSGGGSVNYYSSTTVAGSTSVIPVTGTGSTVGGGSSVAGDGKGNGGTECGNGKTASGTDCVDDSFSGGGTCAAAPSCSGDPIQCAQAQQEWLLRCPSDTETDLSNAIGTITAPGSSTQDFSSVVSESGLVATGAGACPTPPTFTMFGRTITLDIFVQLCNFATLISVVVMACAYLVAARIFVSGVRG